MDEEHDPLDITSDDLALLKESQNIELVVEEDDEASGGEAEEEGEPIYLYVEELENEDNENKENEDNDKNVSDTEGQDSNVNRQICDLTGDSTEDDDDYVMYECLDDADVAPQKKQNKSGKEETNENSSKVKKKTDTLKNKSIEFDKITSNINTSQEQQKIITPKILKVQGGIISPPVNTIFTTNTVNVPTVTSIQTATPRFIPVAPNVLSSPPSVAASLGVQKFLPDQAVFQIVKALGLSVEDIEKHGGTVAISIPDNLIQNGVLDLTKMTVTGNVAANPQNGSPSVLVGVPTPIQNIQNDNSTKGKKFVKILPKMKCYVEECEIYEDKDNILFSPPPDKNVMKIWDICLGSINRRIKLTDRICKNHFHPSDIILTLPNHSSESIKFRLSVGAVPGVNFYTYCCVPGCDSKEPLRMYNFPVYNKTNTELWIYMIRNPSLKTLNVRELLRHRVCYKHFDSGSFSSEKELRRTAAPTKYLPVADYKLLRKIKMGSSLPDFSTVKLFCAYKKCKDRLNPTKKVFPFPLEFDRCQDWLYNCDRLDLLCATAEATYTKMFFLRFGVCQNHFDEREFEDRQKQTLHPNALPKFFEGEMVIDDRNIPTAGILTTENGETEGDLFEVSRQKSKEILPYVCFYLGCNRRISKKAGEQFFAFPKDSKRRKLWLEACGYKNFGEVKVNYKICKMHFSSKMFERNGKLKPNAVPLKSAHTIDGPSERIEKKDTNQPKPLRVDVPEAEEGYYENLDTLDAIVAKWSEKSKLEFLRCAIPKCDKVFTNQSYIGNAQMFPDPVFQPETYKLWLSIIGSPVLMAMTPDILRQTYVVCNKHFDEKSLIQGGTELRGNAAPTRDIPSKNRAPIPFQKYDGLQWKELDSVDLADSKDKTMCLLEDSNIVFPGMGYYLVDYPRDPKKCNKRPYGVYQYRQSKMYALTDDIEFGEALNIHTAIVIDDSDVVEREVMQKILDKRLKV